MPHLLAAPVVHWYGDNALAGKRALRLLRQALPAGRMLARNKAYRGYKDSSNFFTKPLPINHLPRARAEPSKLDQIA